MITNAAASARTLPATTQRDAPAPLLTAGFVGLLLAWFALGFASAPAKPLLPVYVDAVLHRPPIFTSALNALQLATAAVGAIIGGSIADTFGRKRALLLGSLTGPLAAAIFLTHSAWLMVALSLSAGVLSSVQTIGGQTYLMGAVRQVRLGFAAALFFIGSTLGTSLGNLAAAPLLSHSGFGVMAMAMIALSTILIAATALLLPEAQAQLPRRAVPSLAQTFHGYLHICRRIEVLLLIGLRFLPTVYWGCATLLIPLLLYRVSHNPSVAAIYSGVSLALAASCQLLTGRIGDLIGRRRPAAVLAGGVMIAAFLTAAFSQSMLGIYISGVFGACCAWSLSVLMPGLIKELSLEGEEGRTLAMTQLVWSLAMLSGGLAGGALVAFGSSLPFFIMGILNIGAVVVAFRLWRHEPAPLVRAS